jgi:hypothetical protein
VGRNREISLYSERRNSERYRVPHFRLPGSRGPGPVCGISGFNQREWKETRCLEMARLLRLSMAYEVRRGDNNFIEPDYQIDHARLFWIFASANVLDNI